MRFEVTGASRYDGTDVIRIYEAADEDEATRLANADGVVVDTVEVLIDFGSQPTMPVAPPTPTPRPHPRAQTKPLLEPITPSPIRRPPPQAAPAAEVARPAPIPPPPREALPLPDEPTAYAELVRRVEPAAAPVRPTIAPEPSPIEPVRPVAATPAAVGATIAPAPVDAPAPAPAVPYRTPDAAVVPNYRGLTFAALMLRVAAVASYVVGGLFVAILVKSAYIDASRQQHLFDMLETAAYGIGLTLVPCFFGAVCQGLAAACVALRDIARNSWR